MPSSQEQVYYLTPQLTDRVINQLLQDIRGSIGCLYKLSECVAVLDLLISLAHLCTISEYG